MFDFRLQVFQTVARRLNFTKAAAELYITQPAVTKHIHELEREFKVKLFDRNGSRIRITPAGKILLHYVDQLFSVYRNMELEINQLSQKHKGKLRLGASTTIAQYVLPAVLAGFHQKFLDVKITLVTGNTEEIENALKNNEIDLGIIEGRSKGASIKYSKFIQDEIVLVTSVSNPLVKRGTIQVKDLKNISLLMREPGSGTLEVIAYELRKAGLSFHDLKLEMQLASTESIKSYLSHSQCAAFLSIHSILSELKRNELQIVDVKGMNIERYFYFIQLHGQPEALPELFMKFASSHNFR